MSKFVKNLTLEWTRKSKHFSPYTFISLLCIQVVAVASEEETSGRRGPPVTYFGPALDPPWGRSGRKTTTLIRDDKYCIPFKFHQNLSRGSGEEVENAKVYGRRRTTVVCYDNSSLESLADVS